jgi:hypothetical protein
VDGSMAVTFTADLSVWLLVLCITSVSARTTFRSHGKLSRELRARRASDMFVRNNFPRYRVRYTGLGEFANV